MPATLQVLQLPEQHLRVQQLSSLDGQLHFVHCEHMKSGRPQHHKMGVITEEALDLRQAESMRCPVHRHPLQHRNLQCTFFYPCFVSRSLHPYTVNQCHSALMKNLTEQDNLVLH